MQYKRAEAKAWAREKIRGHWTSMISPFDSRGELDTEGLKNNIAKVLRLGTSGLGYAWPGGEFWALTVAERKRICEIAVESAKGKVLSGINTTSSSLKECIELTRHAEESGMDLVNLCPPYMCRSDVQFYEFVKRVSENVGIAIGLYNSPATGLISAQTVAKLAELTNVCVIKEASFPVNPALTYEVFSLVADKIVVSSPYEETFFYEPFADFHQQVMYATPHDWVLDTPENGYYVRFIDLATSGRLKEAAEMFHDKIWQFRKVEDRYFSLVRSRQNGAFPSQVFKAFAKIVGFAGGEVRPPLLPMTDAETDSLEEELRAARLLHVAPRARA